MAFYRTREEVEAEEKKLKELSARWALTYTRWSLHWLLSEDAPSVSSTIELLEERGKELFDREREASEQAG